LSLNRREQEDSSRAQLERYNLAQAVDYMGTGATLSIFLVLDLTAHPGGVPHLSECECAWVARRRGRGVVGVAACN
jgi:hypothetical protein